MKILQIFTKKGPLCLTINRSQRTYNAPVPHLLPLAHQETVGANARLGAERNATKCMQVAEVTEGQNKGKRGSSYYLECTHRAQPFFKSAFIIAIPALI